MTTETTVCVHAGVYLAHDLSSALPLVCIGRYAAMPGELLWERIAQALQRIESSGPYPRSDALTIFARDDGLLTARFDVVITARGAEATIVTNAVPGWKFAPIVVDNGDDVLAIARKMFAVGLRDAK